MLSSLAWQEEEELVTEAVLNSMLSLLHPLTVGNSWGPPPAPNMGPPELAPLQSSSSGFVPIFLPSEVYKVNTETKEEEEGEADTQCLPLEGLLGRWDPAGERLRGVQFSKWIGLHCPHRQEQNKQEYTCISFPSQFFVGFYIRLSLEQM